MEYLWTKGVEPPRFPALEGDLRTGVLVIGGGMAGVLCLRQLRDRGVDCVLAEGNRIGMGITKGTTAVLSAQHDVLYSDLIRRRGADQAKRYLEANLRAVEGFRELSRTIPCDFQEMPSVMYSLTERDVLEQEARAVRSLGFPAEFLTSGAPLPFRVAGAVKYPGMAQFHPLKFLWGAAKGLNIREHTFVRRLEGTTAYTDRGKITAKKVIVATHFPFVNRRGLYFMKLYQKRSFVLALENAPKLPCTAVGYGKDGMYFRPYGDLLLAGGGDRRTGKNGGFEAVREFVRRCFPEAREKYAWANQDCISLDQIPYIGPYSPAMPDVFTATGFNEWGMTTSFAAASLLADLALGRPNADASLYAPDRSMLHPQLFCNAGSTLKDFLIPTVKRCPHLGCALKWNRAEHSWDCPCHGSRFDESGELIDNPAMEGLHVES